MREEASRDDPQDTCGLVLRQNRTYTPDWCIFRSERWNDRYGLRSFVWNSKLRSYSTTASDFCQEGQEEGVRIPDRIV